MTLRMPPEATSIVGAAPVSESALALPAMSNVPEVPVEFTRLAKFVPEIDKLPEVFVKMAVLPAPLTEFHGVVAAGVQLVSVVFQVAAFVPVHV